MVCGAATYLDSYEMFECSKTLTLEMFKGKDCRELIVVDVEAKNIKKTLKAYNKHLTDDINLIYVPMEDKSSLLDFSSEMAEHNLQYGYETARKVLEKKIK